MSYNTDNNKRYYKKHNNTEKKSMKRIIVSVLAVLMSVPAMMADNHEMKAFVDKLMSKMTVKEKIGQLNLVVAGDITTGKAADSEVGGEIAAGSVGGVFNIKGVDGIRALQEVAVKKSRLGIPLLVGMDVIHGYETIFPIPLAQSCSWDMEAIEKGACIAAKEASADGINWTFSPMVDICVDARWGRVAEGGGEDPFLGSRIAEAMVRGYQGDYSQNSNIMACLKHFALYGGAEAGRDYNTVDMSRVRMFNQYLPPYKAAVDAGVSSVMSSFNIVDGVPATGNRWLLTELLRDTWHFGGLVASDYGSIGEMMTHGLGDLPSVSAQALKAGTDMDMCTRGFVQTLEKSLEEGRVTPKAVIPVDLFGLTADYERIKKIADQYELFVIEDGAQGFGGSLGGNRACSFGDISTTSFFPAKPLGCYGDGGAVFTDDDQLAALLESFRIHGKGTMKYDNVRIGVNSRLDTIQAAILQVKLRAFREYELDKVNRAAAKYTELLKDTVKTPVIPDGYYSSWAQYTIQLDSREQRDSLQAALKEQGIPSMIYYPKPMHRQQAFADLNCSDAEYGNTIKLCDTVLSLPMHPYLEDSDVEKVAAALCRCMQ